MISGNDLSKLKFNLNHKRSFSLLELIFAIALIAVVVSISIPKQNSSKLDLASEKIITYLNYTRYISQIDNKENIDDQEWLKKLWTLKFQNCSSSVGGLYYVVYSDTSGGTSHFKKDECLKDPLTNKYLYSNYDCTASSDESKYILLTKEYGVTTVDISCNSTSTIGQISFGYDGKVYSSLGENPKEIDEICSIKLYDSDERYVEVIVEPQTGFIYKP